MQFLKTLALAALLGFLSSGEVQAIQLSKKSHGGDETPAETAEAKKEKEDAAALSKKTSAEIKSIAAKADSGKETVIEEKREKKPEKPKAKSIE